MLIVLLIIFLLITLIAFCFDGFAGGCCAIIDGLIIFAMICNIAIVVDGRVIDEKIQMYTEENEVIESQIEAVVTEYMNYEKETLTELKGDSAITLVSLYPELKSDNLVMTQITTYQENNAKIKELKESEIDIKSAKWWLYFGK